MEARSAQRRLGLPSGGSVYQANLGGSCLRSSWRLGVPSLTTHIHQTSSSRPSSIVHYKHTLQASRTSSIIHYTNTLFTYTRLLELLASYSIHIRQASRTSSVIHYSQFTQTNQTSRTSTIILFTLHTIHYTSRTSSIILDFFIFFTTAGVSPLIDTKFHIKLLLKSNSKTKISYFTMHT